MNPYLFLALVFGAIWLLSLVALVLMVRDAVDLDSAPESATFHGDLGCFRPSEPISLDDHRRRREGNLPMTQPLDMLAVFRAQDEGDNYN